MGEFLELTLTKSFEFRCDFKAAFVAAFFFWGKDFISPPN